MPKNKNNQNVIEENGKDVFFKEFDVPVAVMYCLPGGHAFETNGVEKITETCDGYLIIEKTDGNIARIAPGWLSFDVSSMDF